MVISRNPDLNLPPISDLTTLDYVFSMTFERHLNSGKKSFEAIILGSVYLHGTKCSFYMPPLTLTLSFGNSNKVIIPVFYYKAFRNEHFNLITKNNYFELLSDPF